MGEDSVSGGPRSWSGPVGGSAGAPASFAASAGIATGRHEAGRHVDLLGMVRGPGCDPCGPAQTRDSPVFAPLAAVTTYAVKDVFRAPGAGVPASHAMDGPARSSQPPGRSECPSPAGSGGEASRRARFPLACHPASTSWTTSRADRRTDAAHPAIDAQAPRGAVGVVLRCPGCDAVNLRLLGTGATLNLDMRGCARLTVRAPVDRAVEPRGGAA